MFVPSAYRPPDPFLYQAAVVRAVTAKTYDLQVDVGFQMQREVRVQLRGVQLPGDYDPEDGGDLLTCVSDWFREAATGDYTGDFPLWIRTYRHPDPSQDGQPGQEVYEADVVRKCDAGNLRVHITDHFPDAENGIQTGGFDFVTGRDDPDGQTNGDDDD